MAGPYSVTRKGRRALRWARVRRRLIPSWGTVETVLVLSAVVLVLSALVIVLATTGGQ